MKPYFILPILALSFQLSNPCSSEKQGRTPGPNDNVTEVSVLPAQFTDQPQTFQTDGHFSYAEEFEMRANASGVIEKFFLDVGDAVNPHDPVFVLSAAEVGEQIELKQTRLKEYQARLALAQSKVQNENEAAQAATNEDVEFLDEEPVDEPIEKDMTGETKSSVQTQQALALLLDSLVEKLTKEIEVLTERQTLLTHTSAVHGIVTEKLFSEGNAVKFQDIVLKITQTDPLSVSFALPEEVANFVNKQSKVTITPIDAPNDIGTGTVYFIAPQIDDVSKTIAIKAHINNADDVIKGGQKAKVRVTTSKLDRILQLPKTALVEHDGKNFIFIVVGEQARLVELQEVNDENETQISVKANLNFEDRIFENPPADLKNGAFVKVVIAPAAIEKR